MSYTLNFTDSVNKGSITVADKTVNTETSLSYPGRLLSDYGQIINENFLQLLENFANNTSPTNPIEGQLWYDNTSGAEQLKVYDGTDWISAGGLKKGTSQPNSVGSIIGDLWVDTANSQLYVYSGSGWILIGPNYSSGVSTGSRYQTITSTVNVDEPVIVNYVNGIPVSIISASNFTPKSSINGFGTIYPGVNLSNSVNSNVPRYYGIADQAANLVISNVAVPGTDFVRKSTENILQAALHIRNNVGIDIGETPTLAFSVSGSTTEISNKASDGLIDFKVNNGGVSTTALRIYNNSKIAVGSPTKIPTEALDVVGNIKSSGTLYVGSTTDSSSISSGSAVFLGGVGIAKNINVGGSATIAGDLSIQNINPDTNNTRNIGTLANKFNNVYASNFYGNFTGSFTGNIAGSSSSAGKLASSTTFNMTGDVTGTSFSFDGQTGGTSKTFVTTLNDTYFTTKPVGGAIQTGDLFLGYRSGTGFLQFSQTTITSIIPNTAQGPIVPIGTITMFGGTTAPTGWLLLDGGEYSISTYGALYNVIGNIGGVSTSPTTLFKLPDFRGRFPLGYLGSATTGNRVLNASAQTLGNNGGSETVTLSIAQIPDHVHSLVGDAGTQFFAVTNVTGISDTGSVSLSLLGNSAGTGISITGGINNYSTQEAVNITPPFVAINFIIFSGVF